MKELAKKLEKYSVLDFLDSNKHDELHKHDELEHTDEFNSQSEQQLERRISYKRTQTEELNKKIED
jgi:hypothetical protein